MPDIEVLFKQETERNKRLLEELELRKESSSAAYRQELDKLSKHNAELTIKLEAVSQSTAEVCKEGIPKANASNTGIQNPSPLLGITKEWHCASMDM